jgi:C1A family cysteine protease
VVFDKRGKGYKPDLRHLLGAPVRRAPVDAAVPPPSSDLDHLVVEVLDQGAAPFCFAHAPAQAIRMCEVRDGAQHPALASRLWLVYLAHALEHDVNAFDGAYLSDVFEAVEKLGFPPEVAWPYSDSAQGNFRVRPPEDVVRQAYDQVSIDYSRILTSGEQRLSDVRNALASGCPVVFGTLVSNRFASNDLDADFTYDVPPAGDVDGGHALLFTGHRADGRFRVCNSWGPGWGQGGFCYVTEEVVTWDETVELWRVDFKRRAA